MRIKQKNVSQPVSEFCGEVRVIVSAIDNHGKPMSGVNGHRSMSLTVVDTTVEEVHSFLLDAIFEYGEAGDRPLVNQIIAKQKAFAEFISLKEIFEK